MILNLFKKKEKPIVLEQIIVNRKKDSNIYVGQIVSIAAEEGKNKINYFLEKYPYTYISNKITNEYYDLCQRYNYAIIKDFNDKKIDARVICCAGYLQRFKVDLTNSYENGSSFTIIDGNLYENNKIIGKIIDERYDTSINITFNELNNNTLVSFIKK